MAWDYKEWYADNKVEFNRKRRERYRKRADIRRDARKRALTYYHSHKKRMEPVDRYRIRSADGSNFVTIGRVSREIGRSINRIRVYHKNGVIPTPLFYDSRGWRLYSSMQLSILSIAFGEVEDKQWSLDDASKYLAENWEEE